MNLQEILNAIHSTDEETRRSALSLLNNVNCNDAQDILFTAMGDVSWRVRKDAVESYLQINPDIESVKKLLNHIRSEDNAGLRNSAAEAVIRLGAFCAPSLIAMAQDPEADVRKFVVDIMGAIGDPVFVPVLLNTLTDEDVNVASAAAEHLGSIRDQGAAEQLMRSIIEREDVLFRFSALGALGLIAKPTKVPEVFLKLAEQDILRKAVFECLGAISDETSVGMLLSAFSCNQKNCRSAAVKALHRIYGRSSDVTRDNIREALKLLKENDIVLALIELFDIRDALLTEALIWISDVSKDSRFIPILIEAYTDERTANKALSALKKFGREALQEIISRYATLDDNGRSGLCFLIAECGYSGFNNIIQMALRDSSAQVRKAASVAVGKLGLITLIPDLITLIDDSQSHVYAAVIASLQSLVMIDRSAILSEVEHLCSSKAPHHRKAAAFLLASLGELDRLLLLIKDEDSNVRKSAVTAVGDSRIETSGSVLVLALTDEDPDVRIAAADALGILNNPDTLDVLEHALSDEDVWVQSAVLKAVANIVPTRALAIINKIHSTAEGLLMITCLKILEKIGSPEAAEIIQFALQSRDQDIVRQATKSLERVKAINSY